MQLHTLLSLETVQVGFDAPDKNAAIEQMVELFRGNQSVTDLETVRVAVLEREAQMSTGVGKGLGLPHAKSSGVSGNVAALAILKTGLAYDAIDGEPVRIIFLLVGPSDSKSTHVRVLSRISRLMNHEPWRQAILQAKSKEAVMELIEQFEKEMMSG